MSQTILDYLLVIIAIAVSWSYRAQPPSQGGSAEINSTRSIHPAVAREIGLDRTDSSPVSLAGVLRRICIACGYPSIDAFLEGARESYETVTRAFASGEIEAQAYLLADAVRQTFAAAILARKERGETCELTFICFQNVDITDAAMENGVAQLSVRFRSHVVSATRDVLGKVVAGDPLHVAGVSELWTFERELPSNSPHWVLVGTGALD